MKAYPSIQREVVSNPIYAFNKLDGSNIRAEWSRKNGFSKFGTRKRLLDESEVPFGIAVGLIQDKYSDLLSEIFRKNRWDKVIAFFELHGTNSFAGFQEGDEDPDVTLIDVSVHKRGFLEPKDFLKTFKYVDHAELLYHGNPNSDFIKSVKESTLKGMSLEGVVCKGKAVSPGMPLMFKVKSDAWIEKLREYCKGDTDKFKDLL